LRAYSEAIAAFERLAGERPEDPLVRRSLAELREQAGCPDQGER
jgi:hypothetical protein